MFQQIDRARPDILQKLRQGGADKEAVSTVSDAIGASALIAVKEIPTLSNFMISKIQDEGTPSALRCALAAVLAYLVQPNDLIPDGTSGGYGFVDDRAFLQAGLLEFLKVQPLQGFDLQQEESRLNLYASIMSMAVVPSMQLAVEGLSTTFQILYGLPPQIAEMLVQQIVANPLQAAAPAAPAGFAATGIPQVGGGHWNNGGYFENGNVIIPGGPALVDGELFIPD
jgi:uncharacterized membrane protein YkvA (DUF1232 family)